VSDEVWDKIAERGKFGETEDDVLRRIFGLAEARKPASELAPIPQRKAGKRRNLSIRRQRASVRRFAGQPNAFLVVAYDDRPGQQWKLPADRKDRNGIREVLSAALQFGEANQATIGQLNAIRKALTDAGYHLTK
jgi:hypothetical protein